MLTNKLKANFENYAAYLDFIKTYADYINLAPWQPHKLTFKSLILTRNRMIEDIGRFEVLKDAQFIDSVRILAGVLDPRNYSITEYLTAYKPLVAEMSQWAGYTPTTSISTYTFLFSTEITVWNGQVSVVNDGNIFDLK